MGIRDLRTELEAVQTYLKDGNTSKALDGIEHALRELRADRLLTTTEAAEVLGIRSVNTLKSLLRLEGVPTVRHGNRTMIPLTEVERIQESPRVHGIRASDRQHAASEEFGVPEGLSADELEDLHDSRPGILPWER